MQLRADWKGNKIYMKPARILFIAWLAAFLIPAAFSAASQAGAKASATSWRLSRSELRTLLHAPPSVGSCEKLTAYFRGREEDYRRQAQQMDALLAQREVTAEHAGGKYAQSIDSGRRLREYYLQMAQEMGSRAAFWDRKRQQLR
jgi:hypothetical protein